MFVDQIHPLFECRSFYTTYSFSVQVSVEKSNLSRSLFEEQNVKFVFHCDMCG